MLVARCLNQSAGGPMFVVMTDQYKKTKKKKSIFIDQNYLVLSKIMTMIYRKNIQ